MCVVFRFPPFNWSAILCSKNNLHIHRMWRVTCDKLHTILSGKPQQSTPQIPGLHWGGGGRGMEHSTKVSFPCNWISKCQNENEMKQKQFPQSLLTSPFSLSYASIRRRSHELMEYVGVSGLSLKESQPVRLVCVLCSFPPVLPVTFCR